MRDHIRILGILNIVMGCLTALGGVIVLIAMGGLAGIMGASGISNGDHDAAAAAPFMALLGICIAGFLILLALPSILGGWGLLKFKSWARILIIVISVFHLLNFPFGTALGVYGLWALLSDEGRRLFESGGQAYVSSGSYPARPASQPTYPPPGTK